MRVSQLIDILSDQDPDAEVEMAIIAPVMSDADDITVDRYTIEGVMPWTDDGEDGLTIWLLGGEQSDVESFLDAIEADEAS